MPRRSSILSRLAQMLVSTLLLGLTAGCGSDVEIPELPPARADLPPADDFSALRGTAIDLVFDGRVFMGARSGYVALVAKNGRLVHASLTGHRDLEREIPMAMDTRFQIASMTKPVIGVAAMILVEEGKIGLDDPVSRYVPGVAGMQVAVYDEAGEVISTRPAETTMRVRHLMSFASGMGPGMEPGPLMTRWREEGSYTGTGSLANRVERIRDLPLFEEPGTKWRYGNAFDVLARVIEVAAEEPLDLFLARRIFVPLGMKATHYLKDKPADAPLAVMYKKGEDGDLEPAEQEFRPDDWTPGGTGLVSTAPDYMRFALMLWNDGEYDGTRILRAETVHKMREPQIDGVLKSMGRNGLSFGLGVSVVTDPDATQMSTRSGDFWWSGVYGTHLWISPSTGIVLVVMQQQEMNAELGDLPIAPFIAQGIALGG